MRSVQAVFKKQGHVQYGMNPELWTLLRIICRFARQPGVFVFVFDGPNKAPIKRGKRVLNQPLWLVEYLTSMIDKFGYHHRTVRSAASRRRSTKPARYTRLQATLKWSFVSCRSWEQSISYSPRIQTFGYMVLPRLYVGEYVQHRSAQTCLPLFVSLNSKSIPQDLAVYSASRVQQHLGLTTAGLVLFAIVNGGDYDVSAKLNFFIVLTRFRMVFQALDRALLMALRVRT